MHIAARTSQTPSALVCECVHLPVNLDDRLGCTQRERCHVSTHVLPTSRAPTSTPRSEDVTNTTIFATYGHPRSGVGSPGAASVGGCRINHSTLGASVDDGDDTSSTRPLRVVRWDDSFRQGNFERRIPPLSAQRF
jgi:hypothetical protein